ncbi:MAG: acyl-CoA dehydrogenase family protein, partial [Candidatus Hydrogenedentota bacterium]
GEHFSEELYQKMAENGWLGAVIPEEYGGVALGYVDLICILEEFGTGLMPEPLISSQILGGNTLLLAGTEEQKQEWLPKIAEGATKFTLATYEAAGHYTLNHVETSAANHDDGFLLNGAKELVTDAKSADKIIVSARTSGDATDESGITLFLVDASNAGVTLTDRATMDVPNYAEVALNDVVVTQADVIGEVGEGLATLVHTIDRANVALCAEMCGGMQESLRRTVEYTQERVQFDRVIGSFQAVKHKAANMYVAMESARYSMYFAAMAVDNDMPEAERSISGAKALCSDNYLAITKEAIQLHGGIGYTDEHDIHFFYKRAQATATTFGDSMYHRERYMQEMAKTQAESATSTK